MEHVHPLRLWRREQGKTLTELAEAVGVTASHLSEIERGLNDPSLALAARLSRETNIPIDQFVRDSQ
jgi:transcriptional regulator with XRE-family HTH domain